MDRFRILFKCVKEPKPYIGLDGYELGALYEGRKYNGMYEVSKTWGRGDITKLIDRKLFNEYFTEESPVQHADQPSERDVSLYLKH